MRPSSGWPLDDVLVGVGTLRTVRELLKPFSLFHGDIFRAWDVALRSGVTPQGTSHSMRRLRHAGIVRLVQPGRFVEPARHWRAASYRIQSSHALTVRLADLLAAEYDMVRAEMRPAMRRRRTDVDATSRRLGTS